MKKCDKIITILLTIIAFVVPVVRCPRSIGNINLYTYSYVPKAIVFLICGIGLLIFFFLSLKNKKIKFDTNDKLIFAFWFLAGLSTIFAYDTQKALLGWGNRYTGYLSFTGLILIYYCTKYNFEYFKSFFKWLFLIAAGICIYSFMQYFDFMPLHKLLHVGYLNRFAAGTLGNTNFFGSFVTLFIPAAMVMFLFKNEKKYLAYASIYFGAMICSNTRSAWLAFLIYSIIILAYIIKQKNKDYLKRFGLIIISFSVVFLILLTQNTALKSRIQVIFKDFSSIKTNQISHEENTNTTNIGTTTNIETSENSLPVITSDSLATTNIQTATTKEYVDPLGVNINIGSGRVYIWTLAMISILHHPILGAGPACTYYSYVANEPEAIRYFSHVMKGIPADVHNEFLDVAACDGLPAFFIYMLFIMTITCNVTADGFKKDKLSFAISMSIIGYLIQAFFNICVIGVAPLFWMLLGLAENKTALEEIKKNYDLN